MIAKYVVAGAGVPELFGRFNQARFNRVVVNVLEFCHKHSLISDYLIVETFHPESSTPALVTGAGFFEDGDHVVATIAYKFVQDHQCGVGFDLSHNVGDRTPFRLNLDNPVKMTRHDNVRKNIEPEWSLPPLDFLYEKVAVPLLGEYPRVFHTGGCYKVEAFINKEGTTAATQFGFPELTVTERIRYSAEDVKRIFK